MRLPMRTTGIISYAGLDESVLLEAGKHAFGSAGDSVPERLRMLLSLFPAELVVDMPYIGNVPEATPLGFSTRSADYHLLLSRDHPQLYAGENRQRCFKSDGTFRGGVVAVDEAWAEAFVQYRPFMGERLALHHIGGGHQAVAVPESLAFRFSGFLTEAERALGITQRCQHYCDWMITRLREGQPYEPERLEQDYLKITQLRSFGMKQEALIHAMQDLAILDALQNGGTALLLTDASRQAQGIPQYVPFRRACDVFEECAVTRPFARLAQLSFEGDDFQSDFWLPWSDVQAYLDKRKSALDMRALCEGFQIAPAVDADTRGGVYPNQIRVVSVVDRTLRLYVAETVNNPAYGTGLNPMGLISKMVYLPNSAMLLSDGRLTLESHSITCENTHLPEAAFLRMRALAETQEHKGRLIDALYRRESVLSRMRPGSLAYERARALLNERLSRVEALAKEPSVDSAQLSGYDADISYLRRLADWHSAPAGDQPPRDAQRELCIEAGFAMRAQAVRRTLAELCPKPARDHAANEPPRRQQAPNGQWFEQMDFLGNIQG